MKAEELYLSVVKSYKSLLSSTGSATPGLRAYCRGRQIVYRNFLNWATTHEIASGIKEIERRKQRIRKKKEIEEAAGFSKVSCKKKSKVMPVLYPLHIITDISDTGGDATINPVIPVESQNMQPSGSVCTSYGLSERPVLHGIRITFPNGVKLSVREADSNGIFSLVYGKEP